MGTTVTGRPVAEPHARPEVPVQRVPVLLVAGSGRSGSTLLSRILAAVGGAFFGGEIRYVFQRGLLDNRLCGCHQSFLDCPLWAGILDHAFGGRDQVDSRAVIEAGKPVLRARHIHRNLVFRRDLRRQGAGLYVDVLERLYPAIQRFTEARFLVDSSKLPAYGNVLAQLDSVDLYVVHLVRDPRAAAWSWQRAKAAPDKEGGLMEQRSALKSALLWDVWNWSAGRLGHRASGRYLRLRYEDFLANPRGSVETILAMMGIDDAALPFIDDRTVLLGADHSVAGNPDRLTSGPVSLRAGGDWLAKLPTSDRLLTTALTAPLLARYGYPLRATRSLGATSGPLNPEA